MAPEDYVHAVLADGARPYLHRAGVRVLLGVPEDTGVRVSFAPPGPGRSFRYLHERQGDPAAPSGWDDLLAQPGTGTAVPRESRATPSLGTTVRTAAGTRTGDPSREPEPPTTASETTTAPATAMTAATTPMASATATASATAAAEPTPTAATVSTAPAGRTGPPVVAELVVPGGPSRPAASGTRSRATASETRRNVPGPMRQDRTTATVSPSGAAHPTAAPAPVPAPGPATVRLPDLPVPETDARPRTPAGAPRGEPAPTPRDALARGPRDEPPTALRTGPAGRVPSHAAPRDRGPAAGTAPTGTRLRADAAEDPFTPRTDAPRRHTDPPYRRTGAAPSAAPQPYSAGPAPAPPAVPATPAPPAAPAPPQVLVVRAPAAPTGEPAYWERRHLGRMLRGVVR